jgi:hypothetical protein
LAKVRSATLATIALALVLFGVTATPALSATSTSQYLVGVPKSATQLRLVLLPRDVGVGELARAGLSPGLMSAGLGTVAPWQTYLDIGQGNRIFDSLYDEELPPLPARADACGGWLEAARRRAASAPAEIEPGLLSRALSVTAETIYLSTDSCPFGGVPGSAAGAPRVAVLQIVDSSLSGLRQLVARQRGDDLLIAIARPREESDSPPAIGIAGRGFDGNLTSDSTRLDGYVLSTDVAPTLLQRIGADVPNAMSGQPIRAEGAVDPAAIDHLGARMGVIAERRGPVIGVTLLVWLGLLGIVLLIGKRTVASFAVELVALAVVLLPALLPLGAALEPGTLAEVQIVMFGAPALALALLLLVRGYRALAVACGLTVLVYAADVVAGSPLTALSLLGPNPGLGVRFYGIGNELEALLAVLIVAGTGAGLTGFAPGSGPRRAAVAFLAIGIVAAFVFAAGRFGADVGAAIVFPLGAAVAAAAIAARRRRTALLVVALPFVVVALLALVDLLSGANAHLTHSVLDAGGLGGLGEVAQRRLQLSAHSFTRPIVFVFLPLIVALAALALARRDRLEQWLAGAPAMRAGLLGAVAATAVGTLANDSGALLLEIGAAYLLVFTGFAWAEKAVSPRDGDSVRR